MSALAKQFERVERVSYMTLTENVERRQHRRHDLAEQELPVYAMVGEAKKEAALGRLMDLSAGGMRFKTVCRSIRPNTLIDVQLSLPCFGGIRAFVDAFDGESFSTEWTGRLNVTRVVKQPDGGYEVAGRLLGMNEGERGLLGLYLSTQPMAA